MKMGSLVMKEAFMLRSQPLSYKPMFVIALDISNKKENVGVRLFNDIDRNYDPLSFEYLSRAVFPQLVFHQSVVGCKCIDECVEGCFCFTKNGN
ncbi:putative histone-lysine N-methyltransferase H3 lysine-9 specific SUHV9-like protein [Trifolium medium]|uniref:Putative histone-lysine N-methyltransferase H3 lysine-9 specific SUHV9-like protein n=1 Tax=Trifolium medium TaxID=97028 RepID=A0A392RKN1_9FABA|nr:putative histone-lysine N-methyltransferase H3 lysine-9 specific SUHV9-like protein [Trifolium medium]